VSGSASAPVAVVRDAVTRALAEDVGPVGDITSALLPEAATAEAAVVARVPGVVAGLACVTEVYAQLDPRVAVEALVADGDELVAGARAASVQGPLRAILTGERTALNFLCHLSGVATLTRRFVAAAGDRTRVLDTRKTLPGLRALEKAAVRAGGGLNHRGSLSDLVLVKDNHLAGLGVADAVAAAHARWPGRAVEVECERLDQVQEAVAASAEMVMLDNMTPAAVRECVESVRAADARVLVEVSGGITLDNIADYAAAGAELVSTSAITQSAPALDLSLDVESIVVPGRAQASEPERRATPEGRRGVSRRRASATRDEVR
jgi:nicotinate-nucleotide pyrophosphorylase (carboxylating)